MKPNPLGRPAIILLVEDNPGDALLTREAFEDAKIAVDLHHVLDAESAIAFLQQAQLPGGSLPDLVLLDLNLPGKPGLTVLQSIRTTDGLMHLPVIVLTSSKAPDDVLAAYRDHANSFITKPVHADDFLAAVRTLEDYWLTVVRLPTL